MLERVVPVPAQAAALISQRLGGGSGMVAEGYGTYCACTKRCCTAGDRAPSLSSLPDALVLL